MATYLLVSSTGDALAFTLKAFVELMDHGIVSWDVLQHKFIKNVRHFISSVVAFSRVYVSVYVHVKIKKVVVASFSIVYKKNYLETDNNSEVRFSPFLRIGCSLR